MHLSAQAQAFHERYVSKQAFNWSESIIRTRHKMKISQLELATKLGISVRTLESWERGVRQPSSSAQALIRLFLKSPQFVLENLA
ncbi:helix-turn-helix domain-containing protein [Acinetobacter sp. GXMZU3951]|jgi:DNA-binding transcriptional regulator YiaG